MVDHRHSRIVRRRQLGQGLLLGRRERPLLGAPQQGSHPRHRSRRSWSTTSQLRGISLPILIRFGEILKHRLGEMHQAFQNAIAEHNYKASYCCVYPIKVNQQRQVVEEVFEYGRPVQVRPGSRLEARAAGRAGHRRQRDADHLQRLQGRRVHRDGDAGQEDRPPDHPGGREVHRARPDPETLRSASACGR